MTGVVEAELDDLQEEVRRWISSRRLFARGEPVVVGVSGGADSLCLLHVLWRLQEALGLRLTAAHLNHGIRGEESESDQRFVLQVAESWGIPAVVAREDVPAYAARHKMGLEEAARERRYAFLEGVAERVGASKVAVGHNADDQVETILMHWLRGAGPDGLRGMLPATRRGNIWLVRPLLRISREKIEGYCRRHGLEPRQDSTNWDQSAFRNQVRWSLIPLLQGYNPRIKSAILRSADVLAADLDYLDGVVDKLWASGLVETSQGAVSFRREEWQGLHIALQRRLLRKAILTVKGSLKNFSWTHLESALEVSQKASAGARATLPGRLWLHVDYRRIMVASNTPPLDFPTMAEGEQEVVIPGVTILGSSVWRLEAGLFPAESVSEGEIKDADRWTAYLDADAVSYPLILRRRKRGERFQPLGMAAPKALQDFMVDSRVPRCIRDSLPLVASPQGVVWVPGWRIDERAKVGPGTKRVLRLRLVAPETGEDEGC